MLRKGFFLLALVCFALAGCNSKKDDGGGGKAVSPPANINTVPAGNSPPVKTLPSQHKLLILPEAPTAQQPLMAVFQGDGGRVTYRWERDGSLLEGEERDRLAAEYLKKGATITVSVENNGVRYSESKIIGNIPPEVTQVTFKNPAIHRGVDIELIVTGADADGDAISFSVQWILDGNQVPAVDGLTLPGNRFSRGDQVSFQVVPFDGANEGVPYIATPVTIPNAPPVFVSQPLLTFQSDTYSYQAQAQDPDGDTVTYQLVNPPPGMTIDRRTGRIIWPLAGIPAGEYRINIVADDSQGQKSYQEYSLAMVRQ